MKNVDFRICGRRDITRKSCFRGTFCAANLIKGNEFIKTILLYFIPLKTSWYKYDIFGLKKFFSCIFTQLQVSKYCELLEKNSVFSGLVEGFLGRFVRRTWSREKKIKNFNCHIRYRIKLLDTTIMISISKTWNLHSYQRLFVLSNLSPGLVLKGFYRGLKCECQKACFLKVVSDPQTRLWPPEMFHLTNNTFP